MHTRILVGAAAWLLGAATATGGSLLAVSLLGQGITGTGGLLLTPAAVNRALSSEPAEPAGPPGPAGAPRPAASAATPAAGPSAARTPAAAAAPATPPAAAAGGTAVLTSRGGDVVASCTPAGAYLDSWSPLSGFEVGDVRRGPAAAAQVTFTSGGGTVTMVVSCSAGVPSAVTRSGGHGDD